MFRDTLSRTAAAAALALLAAGCSGGAGGRAALPPTGGPPGLTQSNSLTTYSAFVGSIAGQQVVDVVPFGQSSTLAGAVPAANGAVVYPDGSQQSIDAAGNFDASKSAWATANIAALIANPANEPTVVVFAAGSLAGAQPEEVAVNAYAPGGPSVSADDRIFSNSSSAQIANIVVFPHAEMVMDGRRKLFTAVGQDSSGQLQQLNKASVAWSVTRAQGCGAAAGSIKPLAGDASKALYSAPAAGSAAANCLDQVVATVTAGSVMHSASASVFYFDAKTAAKLGGTLSANGKAAAADVIDLYGGTGSNRLGSLYVRTDAQGKFSALVPQNRILNPLALASAAGKNAFFQVAPAAINPATAGAALANQQWTVAAQTPAPPHIAAPPYAQLIRAAVYYGAIVREKFPFGAPNAQGQFAAGSLEAILAAPHANATGTVTSGDYNGFTFAWDAAGKSVTFTQPGPAAQVQTLAVSISAATVNGAACQTGNACFAFTAKHGASLERDGAWSQKNANGLFSVTYAVNTYDSQHQSAGAPVYRDLVALSQQDGSQTSNFTDARTDAKGNALGTVSASHVAAGSAVLYTYAAQVKSYALRADGPPVEIDYAISNGSAGSDGSGAFKLTESKSPIASDLGDAVNFTLNTPAAAAASGNQATGTIDAPAISGLTSGHAASFAIANSGKTTLTEDPSLGGVLQTFQL
ncbi:MAG TPA: hypothetical protein VFA29_00095 [Candidatus Baltobacteraceae bacterium]|nr:hypothetical protein [Candidatus Baltobacteraceae bacterium]